MHTLHLEDYIVSEDGTITNKKNGHIVKPQLNGKGYLRVSIGGKLRFVHRLVAEAYIPNPENKPQVNHKDGNKLNNCVDNLEWVDNNENRKHAVSKGLHLYGEKCPFSKLTHEDVAEIRKIGYSIPRNELATMFGISRQSVNDILKFRTWKTVEKIC